MEPIYDEMSNESHGMSEQQMVSCNDLASCSVRANPTSDTYLNLHMNNVLPASMVLQSSDQANTWRRKDKWPRIYIAPNTFLTFAEVHEQPKLRKVNMDNVAENSKKSENTTDLPKNMTDLPENMTDLPENTTNLPKNNDPIPPGKQASYSYIYFANMRQR